MMKKLYIYILTSILLLLSSVSCNNFLEVDNRGKVSIPSIFADMEGVRSARMGAYRLMFAYYSNDFYIYPDLLGSSLYTLNTASTSTQEMFNFNFQEESTGIGWTSWRNIYEAVGNINNILHFQPELLSLYPSDKAELERIKGEMLFLRALCHFDLYRLFAQPYNYTSDASHLGIAYKRTAPSPYDVPSRSTAKEVFDLLLEELSMAEEIFQDKQPKDAYYVSLRAIQALKARVYLYMNDWDNAIKYTTLAMNGMELAQGEKYTDMFLIYEEIGEEVIFRLDAGIGREQKLMSFYGLDNPQVKLSDSYIDLYKKAENLPSTVLVTEAKDLRANKLMKVEMLEDDNGNKTIPLVKCGKYDIKKRGNEMIPNDESHYAPIVIRLSEMYLIRAEAYLNKNELSNAAEDIKKIIGRAMQKDPSEIVVQSSNKDMLKKTIDEERIKELAFEGHHFFDLMRRNEGVVRDANTNSTVTKIEYPNDIFVLPIPFFELEVNPNMQGNPGVNSRNLTN